MCMSACGWAGVILKKMIKLSRMQHYDLYFLNSGNIKVETSANGGKCINFVPK